MFRFCLNILHVFKTYCLDCGTPPLVENAMAGAISGLAFPGTEVVYSCDPGYVASPEPSDLRLTCQISGQWTHEHFECLRGRLWMNSGVFLQCFIEFKQHVNTLSYV